MYNLDFRFLLLFVVVALIWTFVFDDLLYRNILGTQPDLIGIIVKWAILFIIWYPLTRFAFNKVAGKSRKKPTEPESPDLKE